MLQNRKKITTYFSNIFLHWTKSFKMNSSFSFQKSNESCRKEIATWRTSLFCAAKSSATSSPGSSSSWSSRPSSSGTSKTAGPTSTASTSHSSLSWPSDSETLLPVIETSFESWKWGLMKWDPFRIQKSWGIQSTTYHPIQFFVENLLQHLTFVTFCYPKTRCFITYKFRINYKWCCELFWLKKLKYLWRDKHAISYFV